MNPNDMPRVRIIRRFDGWTVTVDGRPAWEAKTDAEASAVAAWLSAVLES